jgi:hypothetical protein
MSYTRKARLENSTKTKNKDDHTILSDKQLSPAVSYVTDEVACFHIIKHIFEKHKNMKQTDIDYAANVICDYVFAYGVELKKLFLFLVYSDVTGICKYAITFNEQLDYAIKHHDKKYLIELLLGPNEMFIEYYYNDELTEEEKDYIIQLLTRELFSMAAMLDYIKENIIDLDNIDLFEESYSEYVAQDGTIQLGTIANKCYNEICIQDASYKKDDNVYAIMQLHSRPAESMYAADHQKVYCFDTFELLEAVTEEYPINPKTKKPFSDLALRLIYERLHKEIAMYNVYLDNKDNNDIWNSIFNNTA